MADWIHARSSGQYPPQESLNEAAQQGNFRALLWMLRKTKITPGLESILKAANSGYEGCLIMLLQHRPECLLDPSAIDALISREYWALIDKLLSFVRLRVKILY
jgi:hypothetical protein